MRQPQSVAILFLGVIVGCAAERVFAVPPARAGATPQRWEYACEEAYVDRETTEMANKYGQQGWEMVATTPTPLSRAMWCFKRPLP
jgi:hypothetical protein